MISVNSFRAKMTSTMSARASRCCIALLLLFFLILPSQLHAQLSSGSISGIVKDPSGASIPGAKVTLVDQDKGFNYEATTDSSGRYLFSSVPPGTYRITAESARFQTQRQDGVRVDVSQNVSVDFSMVIGTSTEVVEVNASTVQLQTEDATTGQVVNRRFVNDLPLVDRNFTNLTYLAPGVNETDAPGTKNAQGGINFNSNGSRNATADVLIDGASATNFDQNSGIQNVLYTPSVDSVEEFKVQQTNFSAEYGFAVGAIINVVTRSGSNQFHGSAYEFFRNSVMDANDFFSNAAGQPISPLKRNDFGGTIGGPIRKDKTFFFFDYEGIREHTATNSGNMSVPTPCMRGDAGAACAVGTPALGNFGELCTNLSGTFNAAGMCSNPDGQLWDPFTGQIVQNAAGTGAMRQNFIPFNNLATYQSPGSPALNGTPFQLAAAPGNLIDPAAANLFKLFPEPNLPNGSLASGNFFNSGTNSDSDDRFDIKVDHRFSQADLLTGRFSRRKITSTSFSCFGNTDAEKFADPCSGGPGTTKQYQFTMSEAHTFSPTVVMTVTFGYLREADNFPGIGSTVSNFNSLYAATGLPAYLNNGFDTTPSIAISGYNTGNAGHNLGTSDFSITREGQDAYHLGGSVGWIHGKHEFKSGGEWRARRINHGNPGWPSGFFGFDQSGTSMVSNETDQTTGTPTGGDGLASFLTGVGSFNGGTGGCTPCQQGFNNFVSTQSFQYAAFFQDNFKATSKLTLNLGLRYEINTPRTERFNRMNWLDPTAASPLQLTPAQLAVAQAGGISGSALQALGSLQGTEVFVSPQHRQNYYYDYHDVSPRFGLAYQLPHRFVVRGGYGIYYSTPRSGAAGTGPWGYQGFNIQPPWLTTFNLDHVTPYNRLSNTSCQFTAPFTCGVAPPPGNSLGAFNDIGSAAVGPILQISKNTPYEQAWSLGFQKELPGKILLDATYVGKKGTHLYLGGFRDQNIIPQSAIAGMTPTQIGNLTNLVANPFFFSGPGTCDPTHFICNQASSLAAPQVPQFQLLLPHPQYTNFQGDSPPIANSIYHALQIRAEKEFSNGLQFLVTYTYAKSIDDASSTDDSVVFLGGGFLNTGTILSVQNPYDLRGERAESVFDIPRIFQASYVYELPVGRGKQFGRNMNGILNAIVGGWQTNGIVRIDSGRPILPLLFCQINFCNSSNIPTFGQRPELNGVLLQSGGAPERYVVTNVNPNDPATANLSYFSNANIGTVNAGTGALTITAPFTLGSSPRTLSTIRQPGARDVSMSIFKEFPLGVIHEGMRLQFRAESFNTFNHPHFAGPDTLVGSPTFGQITSLVNDPRQLQLALKLNF